MSCPLDSKSHHVNISCVEGLAAREAQYVYNKCKNGCLFNTEQVYDCECNDKQ